MTTCTTTPLGNLTFKDWSNAESVSCTRFCWLRVCITMITVTVTYTICQQATQSFKHDNDNLNHHTAWRRLATLPAMASNSAMRVFLRWYAARFRVACSCCWRLLKATANGGLPAGTQRN